MDERGEQSEHRLGEFELIAALRERIARAGAPERSPCLALASGDDAAVTEAAGAVVTSVDALVEDVHFRAADFPPEAIGHKALAAALSDLAAMGAEPGEAYVQLGLPERLADEDCLRIAAGLGAVAARHGVWVAGGDVSRSAVLFLAVTAVGYAESAAATVRRAGARPGDVLTVTGELGGAAAGLRLLRDPGLASAVAEQTAEALRRRQREPEPRLAAGRALAAAGATAMIDVSDGLGADALHLAEAGGVAIAISLEAVPVAAGVAEVAGAAGEDPVEPALSGGEDYELLATLPAEAVEGARAALAGLGLALTAIGTVEAGSAGVEIREPGGGLRQPAGYDQLRRSPGRSGPA